MYTITLLSSFHIELGKCNTDELYKIIEEIRPEVLFEELCPRSFHRIYADECIPQSLEAKTIKRYLKKYPIEHFPVDTYPIDEKLPFSGADVIVNNSIEYHELWEKNVSLITQNGYSFLNSNICIELLDKIRAVEENTLLRLHNEKLFREHALERELHDARENEMLRNIYTLSKHHPYNRALFICGAEHRKKMMEKIQGKKNKESLHLNWTFYTNEHATKV